MEETSVTEIIINTINEIFDELFSSIDNNLYGVLDDITFINTDILNDNNIKEILGVSTSDGILLIANSLLIAYLIYFAAKYLLSNLTYMQIESPAQFLIKLILCGICMNFSYFILEIFINIMSNITFAIRGIGEDLFSNEICFSELINIINNSIAINTSSINIFSIDGLIKGTLTISLFSLVFSYALRYIMIKVFILIAPFAFLSLSQKSTSFFFKVWLKNLFSLFFIQIIVSIVLLILFSMEYSSDNLLTKILYIGGIYALIRINSFVKEFIGGITTDVKSNIGSFLKFSK